MRKMFMLVIILFITVSLFSQVDTRGTIKIGSDYRGLSDEIFVTKVMIYDKATNKLIKMYQFGRGVEGYENDYDYIILNLSDVTNKIVMTFNLYEHEEDPIIGKFLDDKYSETRKNNIGKRYTPLIAEIPTNTYYIRVLMYKGK